MTIGYAILSQAHNSTMATLLPTYVFGSREDAEKHAVAVRPTWPNHTFTVVEVTE